jgi:hypothetical protein
VLGHLGLEIVKQEEALLLHLVIQQLEAVGLLELIKDLLEALAVEAQTVLEI